MSEGKLYLTPKVYNTWMNDKRTVKKRLKDTKKLLKRRLRCMKN